MPLMLNRLLAPTRTLLQRSHASRYAARNERLLSMSSRALSQHAQSSELEMMTIEQLPTQEEVQATIDQAQKQARDAEEHAANAVAADVHHMPIRAVHLARKLDIVQLFQKLYTDRFKVQHFMQQDSLVLRLRGDQAVDEEGERLSTLSHQANRRTDAVDPPTTTLHLPGELISRRASDKWVVYFEYGAVVFFNCEAQLTSKLIHHAKKFCQNVFKARGHDEELLLVSNPAMAKWSQLTENNVFVQCVDHNNIHVIAGVLAQTVALELYERQMEAILTEFETLNANVQQRGSRHALLSMRPRDLRAEKQQHHKLFQIVATNNALLIDVVSKLRVLDRKRPGDAAWTHARTHRLWETLVDEFELHERFENLNFKLELIQHNTKFFLEVLGTHKSERLEWYIIVLIAVELLVSLYELGKKMQEKKVASAAVAAVAANTALRDEAVAAHN